jgi:selenium metabolism protein YedF
MIKVVDTKGLLCPVPLIAAKKALRETSAGESFVILTDNQTSFDNLCRFLKDNRADFVVKESEGVWSINVTKTNGEADKTTVQEYCTSAISHFQKGDFIVVISSDKMGEGDDQLGHLLIANFIKALKDLDKLPQKIIFYNNGVKLVTTSSAVIDHLRDLENMGVELVLCSTCINHYSLESSIGAGTVSNMYHIAEIMASAGNIIRP